MKASTVFTAAAVMLASGAQAQVASVINNCAVNAYVQSVPFDGSASGPLVTLAPHGGVFREAYRPSGSTVKMGTLPALGTPLFFGYSQSADPALTYYNLVDTFGNPFKSYRVAQHASTVGCPGTSCGPNDPGCYGDSNNMMERACRSPTDVTVTLCATS